MRLPKKLTDPGEVGKNVDDGWGDEDWFQRRKVDDSDELRRRRLILVQNELMGKRLGALCHN